MNDSISIFTLKRDGKEIIKGSEITLLQYIHNNHCYSMSHALRYEGYSVEKI
jgi:hypothetical protein